MDLSPPAKRQHLASPVLSTRQRYCRSMKRDLLCEVMRCIEEGELEKLKLCLDLLRSNTMILRPFKDRLTQKNVSRGCSPLVVAAQNNRFGILKYILQTFDVNIEQETISVLYENFVLPNDTYREELGIAATALWTASALGYTDCVNVLIDHGANIDHPSADGSTPLLISISRRRESVCELLVNRGADIEKCNKFGYSPLIAALSNWSKSCVKVLINKGADVNSKHQNGNTPLHDVRDVETAKILVEAGARYSLNNDGLSPAIAALSNTFNCKKLMKYFHTMFKLKTNEIYDFYCLCAASEMLLNEERPGAEPWMKRAAEIRSSNPKVFSNLPLASEIYGDIQEPATKIDVRRILQNDRTAYFVSAIYFERIVGDAYDLTGRIIRSSAESCLREGLYDLSIKLWERSLKFEKQEYGIMSYELLNIVRGLSVVTDNGFSPSVDIYFKWGAKNLAQYDFDNYFAGGNIEAIAALFHLIAVWIKIAENIKEDEERRKKEHELISEAVQVLISAMGDKCPILIACLYHVNYMSGEEPDIPLHKALTLFLEHGCSVQCEDKRGNFPLHIAATMHATTAPNCVKVLLEYGAHIDAVNFDNKTALDICDPQEDPVQVKSLEVLKSRSVGHISLQCLSSCALIKHKIDYSSVLPQRILEFVSWHGQD